jgi:hypothetical protein
LKQGPIYAVRRSLPTRTAAQFLRGPCWLESPVVPQLLYCIAVYVNDTFLSSSAKNAQSIGAFAGPALGPDARCRGRQAGILRQDQADMFGHATLQLFGPFGKRPPQCIWQSEDIILCDHAKPQCIWRAEKKCPFRENFVADIINLAYIFRKEMGQAPWVSSTEPG